MLEKFLGQAKGTFNIITIIELILSVFYMIIGIAFFSNSNLSSIAVSIFTGLLLIFKGGASIYAYLKRGSIVLFNNDFIYGIIFIIVGFIGLFLGKFLSIALGMYFLICGFQKLNHGMFLKKFNESSWLITSGVGAFFIIIGIISFFTSGDAVVRVAGICTLGFGTMNFINILLLRRRSRYFIA